MEIEQLRQELNHLLDNLVEHSQTLSEERQIPPLEISVVLAKVNQLQEKLVVLRHLLNEQEQKRKAERQQQLKKQSEDIPKVEIPLQVDSIIVEEEPQEKTETSTVQPEKTEISSRSLTDVFSLNDRYLYANELFNKDMSAFNNFIKSVDSSSSLAEVHQLMSTIKSQLNNQEENQYFISFSEVVTRKFS